VDIAWVNRGLVIVRVGAGTLHVGGEALLDRDPDFLIYSRYITHWEDGSPISDEEKTEILDRLIEEAARRGWRFEIEW
jgi:hypothetical protein